MVRSVGVVGIIIAVCLSLIVVVLLCLLFYSCYKNGFGPRMSDRLSGLKSLKRSMDVELAPPFTISSSLGDATAGSGRVNYRSMVDEAWDPDRSPGDMS
ncbi:small integral membrane protein 35-like [Acipenser oxyrinchus oxyrinchus]|uniref:Small integral membrane protein 35-like n=1 Tax=Acipenser oxyrinchus oxyrinchus TaxID=40147 RepID=A0AAD8CGL7_ACIOX|nr:small integral membrane protein 35-like [Acipenser oxyrinchus oxyrinchus]